MNGFRRPGSSRPADERLSSPSEVAQDAAECALIRDLATGKAKARFV